MSDLSRVEQLLRNALGEDIYEVTPQSRVEVLLQELNELIEGLDTSVDPEDIATAVAAYLDEHLTTPTSPPVDTSLAIAGAAADAKKTGDEIGALKEGLSDLLTDNVSINLFDMDSAIRGYYITQTGSVKSSANMFYAYIPVDVGTYMFYGDYSTFGSSYVKRIHLYNSEKTRLSYITGEHFGDETGGKWYGVKFTITQSDIDNGVKYAVVSQHLTNIQRFMVVKGETYPDEYVEYYNYKSINCFVNQDKVYGGTGNPLVGKTALFFGDSICDGITAQDDLDGWAGRIGRANEMAWYNYGTSGGTFAPASGHTNITNTLDTAIAEFTDADYIILEGGTNDADLDAIELGTFTANDYSGVYDTTTFSGAFETAIYKALTFWKHQHVGYIVAQKMGRLQTSLDERYAFFVRAMDICKKWGVPVLNLWDNSILNPAISTQYDSSKTSSENIAAGSMYTDGQHLTPDGYEYLTPIIAHWMRGI